MTYAQVNGHEAAPAKREHARPGPDRKESPAVSDSAPVAAPGATRDDPELADLRHANRQLGLMIQRTNMSGYKFKVIRGSATRFVGDGEDAQAVIDRNFR